jgi:hypothetical protein
MRCTSPVQGKYSRLGDVEPVELVMPVLMFNITAIPMNVN